MTHFWRNVLEHWHSCSSAIKLFVFIIRLHHMDSSETSEEERERKREPNFWIEPRGLNKTLQHLQPTRLCFTFHVSLQKWPKYVFGLENKVFRGGRTNQSYLKQNQNFTLLRLGVRPQRPVAMLQVNVFNKKSPTPASFSFISVFFKQTMQF